MTRWQNVGFFEILKRRARCYFSTLNYARGFARGQAQQVLHLPASTHASRSVGTLRFPERGLFPRWVEYLETCILRNFSQCGEWPEHTKNIKNGEFLKFRTKSGNWVTTKSVKGLKPRPFLLPTIVEQAQNYFNACATELKDRLFAKGLWFI